MKLLPACFLLIPLLCLSAEGEESPWEFTGAAGLSYSDGNSDSSAFSVQLLSSYINDAESAYFGVDYFYTEDNSVRSTDSIKIYGQYNHDISERLYLGAYSGYFRDTVADIGYRIDPSILLGYRVFNEEDVKLSFDAGPGYTWRERGRVKSDNTTIRLAQKFEYHLSHRTKFWQSASFTPRIDDLADYLVNFDMGLETRLTSQWSLRTFVQNRIDSTPAAGKGRTDTSLILGVAYDLGGLPEPAKASHRRSLMPEKAGPPEEDKGWASIAAIGYSANQGNSDNSALNLAWNTSFHSDEREFFFDISQKFNESNGVSSEDETVSRLQYHHFLSKRHYVGSTLRFLHDDPSDIDYRATPGLLVGYFTIKNKATKLSFETGPSYTFEKQGGVEERYASFVVAERFSHKFNDRVAFVQAVEGTAELDNFQNHSIVASIGLDTKINHRLIWKIAASYSYDGDPAPARLHHDTSVTSSLAIRF